MPLIRKPPAEPSNPTAVSADARPAADILRDGTTDERWAAARALGAVPDGTIALAAALKTESDPRVREAIFTSLVRLGSRESVDAVLPSLRADDANIRMGALDALRSMIDATRAVLPDLLADPDADIRVLSCDLARELPSEEATSLLCGLLARESEANVCAAAVDVLADVGEAAALPFLKACAMRFEGATFLTFAVKIAMDRIVSERAAGHG